MSEPIIPGVPADLEASGRDHPAAEDLALRAVDALSAREARAVDRHVLRCVTCREELAALRESAALLAESVPPLVPPLELRRRVLAHARSAPRPEPSAWGARGWPLLAAASVLVTVATAVGLWRLDAERAELRQALAAAESRVAGGAAEVARRDSLLAVLLGPRVEVATLASTGTVPTLRLFRDRDRGALVVAAHRLPPAPAGRTYQLWGIGADGRPQGLGTFNTSADGSAVIVLPLDAQRNFAVSAVTEEPSGGSPGPTRTPFLVGRWGE